MALISLMSGAEKLGVACEEGSDFVGFLRASFLAPSGRTLVFSSHIVTTVHELSEYLTVARKQRDVLVEPLPKITDLAIARAEFGQGLMIQEFLFHGLIPALVQTQKDPPSWIPAEDFKIDEAGVRQLFLSFFTGAPDLIHADMLPYMDTVAADKVVWIMSRMKMVFGKLPTRFAMTEMGDQLVELCDLMQCFLDSKAQTGDGFEILFALAFVLRVGCGYHCEPFFPSLHPTTATWSFSINRFLKTTPALDKINTWAKLKTIILAPPPNVSFPHVAYIRPTHGSFYLYDGFALMYDKPDMPPFAQLAFQLKRGRDIPEEGAEDADLNSFLVRDSRVKKEIKGWRCVSDGELIPFFGASGSQWVPASLDDLLQ